jgi:N-acyl-phosphatidylethanolamine-hydrolysing phospholipase D
MQLQAHQDLAAHKSISMHFNTFQLTDESIDAPAQALKEALLKHGVPEQDFLVMLEGEGMRSVREIEFLKSLKSHTVA